MTEYIQIKFKGDYNTDYQLLLTEYSDGYYGDYVRSSRVVGYGCRADSSTDNIKDLRMLNLLLLENEALSDKEKMDYVTRNKRGVTMFMTSTQYIRLKILQYFSKISSNNTLYKILIQSNEKDHDDSEYGYSKKDIEPSDKIAFHFITLKSPKQGDVEQAKQLLQFIMDDENMKFHHTMHILTCKYTITKPATNVFEAKKTKDTQYSETSARKACMYGYGSIVIRKMNEDENKYNNYLHKFLCPEEKVIVTYYKRRTPLILIAMSEYKDEGVIKLIFEECGLSMVAKRQLDKCDIKTMINTKDEDGFNAFYYAMMKEKQDYVFYEMLKYLKNDQRVLVDLLMDRCPDGNMVISQLVKKSHVDGEKLLAVFRAITDDDLLRKMMDKKNKKFQTLHNIQEAKHALDGNKVKIEELIFEVMDYLKLVERLREINVGGGKQRINTVFDCWSEYMTNSFLTACKLVRCEVILKLMMKMKDDRSKGDGVVLRNYC